MNFLKLKNLLLLIGFFVFNQITNAQTIFVSGHITENTTWLADTVKIAGDITIDNGKTLTINPGTYLQSQGYYKFVINGCIKAVGTQSDSIIFTIKDTTGFSNYSSTSGSWDGFYFMNTPITNDTSEFEYCNVKFCKKPVGSLGNGGAFSITNYSKIKIIHCTITKNFCTNEGGALCCIESDPVIKHTTFKNNECYYHGGAVCYFNDSIVLTNFSYNILIYNLADA
jgi:hypothetical protein